MSDAEADETKTVAEALGAIDILARALHVRDTRLQPTLDAITAQAAAAHPAARDAGLILLRGGQLVPQATTGQAPQALDLWQQQTGQGPCIQAAREQAMIYVEDVSRDPRWPGFSAEAQALEVGSMLCTPLWVDEQTLGTLSLYAPEAAAFGEHDQRIAGTFATLAALALAEARRTENLATAIASRDLIGQ